MTGQWWRCYCWPEILEGTMSDPVFQTLEHAKKPILDEMFQNGWEQGNRIWDDDNHPLKQAFVVLLQAQCQLPSVQKEAAALLEQHRRMEEGL